MALKTLPCTEVFLLGAAEPLSLMTENVTGSNVSSANGILTVTIAARTDTQTRELEPEPKAALAHSSEAHLDLPDRS